MGDFRAIIADDHPMCREAARIALDVVMPGATVEPVATLAEALDVKGPVDLVMLDLALPDSRGVSGLIDVARCFRQAPVLVVSGSERADIERKVKDCGARGFVAKAAPITELIEAIRTVADGGHWFSEAADTACDAYGARDDVAGRLAALTPAEARVLRAMRGGRLNKQIAHDLSLSEITVKQHVKAILRKLGVVNRTQAVLALRDLDGDPADAA